jgi:hypothetical protein
MPIGLKMAMLSGALVAVALAGAVAVKAQQAGPETAAPQPEPSLSSAKPKDEPSQSTDRGQATPTAPAEASAAEPDSSASATPEPPPKPVVPLKRPRYAVAVIQALDKVTAETLRFEAPINQPIRYKTLIFTVRACETTAPDEPAVDAAAHVEIDSQPLPTGGKAPPAARQVFRGWMYANAPGLNLFQHPVYDAWLIACKIASPPA